MGFSHEISGENQWMSPRHKSLKPLENTNGKNGVGQFVCSKQLIFDVIPYVRVLKPWRIQRCVTTSHRRQWFEGLKLTSPPGYLGREIPRCWEYAPCGPGKQWIPEIQVHPFHMCMYIYIYMYMYAHICTIKYSEVIYTYVISHI